MGFLFEVCVDSVESALEAQAGGAHRIELCANFMEGGTTPSIGMVKTIRSLAKFPVYILIRPRGGDFLYSDYELQVMREDIKACAALGANGIVLGVLNAAGEIDVERMKPFVALCKRLGLDITFHRAFDVCRDPLQALETLIELEIPRVLTSGQQTTAAQGVPVLKSLVEAARGRIKVMAGAGVSEANAADIVRRAGVRELHGSARVAMRSRMKFLNPEVSFDRCTSSVMPGDQEWMVTDRAKVAGILRVAGEAFSQLED
ncbi:Cu2+ homeostasis protein CutC [Klebsormidium nitens]|uniref:Copper homeostasis protein cutC homolog n=1 Tax=Klebsormidium nitens TaxID=105231 RepID=A0A1Y1I463_KLENI|nr:Cu2+ homeostasis protein CutC [Klebsormidium nitens]|eukprot:GAQ85724.1 Cu2+ homeostasis protein CutC [Klebsormidium nitens]